jgi:hypothetical protein
LRNRAFVRSALPLHLSHSSREDGQKLRNQIAGGLRYRREVASLCGRRGIAIGEQQEKVMRKDSAKLAAQAFAAGKAYKGAGACYSTGDALWSYLTCIAARALDGRIVINGTRYSVTTTRHQTAARIAVADKTHATVLSMPRGASPLAVIAAAA